jgi:hypothetical protein
MVHQGQWAALAVASTRGRRTDSTASASETHSKFKRAIVKL